MTDDNRTNIKIADEVHEQHNKRRKREGLSWTEYMRRLELGNDGVNDDLQDTIDDLKNELSMTADPTVQPDVAGLIDKVDRLADAVQEATDAAQRAERKVDELQR